METTHARFPVLLVSALCSISLLAQIPNGSFEQWVDNGAGLEPVDWTTTNSDPDISVDPVTPACAGEYAMRVRAIDLGFLVLNGTAISQFAYDQRPTQLSACLRTNVMEGDRVYLILSLSAGDSIIASPLNCTFWIDTNVTQYTYFTFPITYNADLIPDTANIIVMAGTFGNVQVGTEITVDDLEFGFGTAVAGPDDGPAAMAYPNPSAYEVFIRLEHANSGRARLQLLDATGRLVRDAELGAMPDGRTVRVGVGDLPEGLYHYRILAEGAQQQGAILVAH